MIRLGIVIGMIIGAGVIHRVWASNVEEAVPMALVVPGWTAGPEMPNRPEDVPEKTVVITRTYSPIAGGKSVTVSHAVGHPGIVAVHTPDVCYVGSGYTQRTPPRRERITLANGTSAEYFWADFTKGSEKLRVRWAWAVDATWEAPESPRWRFARLFVGSKPLHKFYVVSAMDDDVSEEPFQAFTMKLALAWALAQ